MPEYPEAQTVRITFVEAPRHQEEVSGRGLCDQLRVAGQRTVVSNTTLGVIPIEGLIGYREVSVDGKPIVDAGGWGLSSAKQGIGSHPLERIY